MDEETMRGPLLFIFGGTGVGKSKLAIRLAQALAMKAEVINCDSMQVYDAMRITTNQATQDEKEAVPHHLLGFVKHDKEYSVLDYRKDADRSVSEVLLRKNLPILCGGTGYYGDAVLFHTLMNANQNQEESFRDLEGKYHLTGRTVADLYNELKEVDPAAADTTHPNDERKIKLALLSTLRGEGTSHSERLAAKGVAGRGGLRYVPAAILWLECQDSVLQRRIEMRADDMITRGMLDEIREFHRDFVKDKNGDDNVGFMQNIGYKEYLPYIQAYPEPWSKDGTSSLSESKYYEDDTNITHTEAKERKNLLWQCRERYIVRSRQYSKRQWKYFKGQTMRREILEQPGLNVYGLDANKSSEKEWSKNVLEPSLEVAAALLQNVTLPDPLDISTGQEFRALFTTAIEGPNRQEIEHLCKQIFACDVCDGKPFQGLEQYEIHLRSKKHRHQLKALRQRDTEQTERISDNNNT
eukprot:Clim_evm53s148 gene=Clim_evmTU53s148